MPSWRLEVIGSYGRTVVEERHGAKSAWQQLDGNFAERVPVFWTSRVFMAIAPFLHSMVCWF